MTTRERKPSTTLATLAAELEQLDTRRQQIIGEIRRTASVLLGGDIRSSPGRTTEPPSEAPVSRRGGRRRGFKMSKEARAKIAAAQRARWARVKKAE